MPTAAIAQAAAACSDGTTGVPGGSLVLRGEYLCIGLSDGGTMGVGGSTQPGIRHSPTGNVAVNGTYDYLTPGSPYDGFALQADNVNGGTMLTNTNGGSKAFTGTLTDGSSGTDNQATWTSTNHAAYDITNVYSFSDADQTLKVRVTITAKTDIVNLRYLRSMDPDAKASAGDSSSTNNALGYGSLPATDFVYTEALDSKVVLSMYSNSSVSHEAKLFNGCCSIVSPDTPSRAAGTGDWGIGIAFYVGDLANGSSVVLEYEYRFAADLASAVGGGSAGVPDIDTTRPGGYTADDVNNGLVNPTFDGGTLALSAGGTVGGDFTVKNTNGTIATGSSNVSFTGNFSGAGGITKSGSGTMTVSGNNTNAGGFTVTEGSLNQTGGTIAGPVDVSGGSSFIGNGTVNGTTTVSGTNSVLMGAGTFGNVVINNGSFHKPGNSPGTVTINGNYTVAAGGTLEVEVASDGVSDKLIVNGTATLSGNLRVVGYGQGFTAASYNYLVLENDAADAISSDFSSVRNDFAFYTVSYSLVAGTGNDMQVTLTRNAQTFASIADTDNLRAAGAAMDSLPTSAYSSLMGLMTPAEVRALLRSLSGEVYSSGAAILADRLSTAYTDRALGASNPFTADCGPREGVSDAVRADCVIARSFQVTATGGVRNYAAANAPAASAWQGGLEAQMLLPFELGNGDSHAYFGAVLSQEAGKINVGGTDADTTATGAGLIAGWNAGDLEINAAIGATLGQIKSQRTVGGTAANGTADLAIFGGSIGVAYTFALGDTLELRPFGALTHIVSSNGGFSETGTSGLNYAGVSGASSQTLATIGLGLSNEFELDGYTVRPRADVSITQRIAGGPASMTGTIGGSNSFTTVGADSGPTKASFGLGATFATSQGLNFDADYRLDISPSASSHTVRLSLKGAF